jgi:hypothetical protein
MEIKIVLVPDDCKDARKVCNDIKNTVFTNLNELKETLIKELGTLDGVTIYDISEFMEDFNNSDDDYGGLKESLIFEFMSYVKVIEENI